MKKNVLCLLCLILCLYVAPVRAATFDHQHGLFDILLKKHVMMSADGRSSRVDYKGIANDKALMGTYLSEISSVSQKEFDGWSREKQLAFLINAYNAYTLDLVIRNYPVKSIRDIGSIFRKTWDIRFASLLGKKRTLDEIEHGMIRKKGVYDEPRIHVALVCAAIGCPALRNEAYTFENLNGQLEKALALFLTDRSRNRYDAKNNRFHVSPIFKWYESDFKDKYGSLEKFLTGYAGLFADSDKDVAAMKQGASAIEFGDYNWKLNGR